MSSANPLAGTRAKIKRAKKHLIDLDAVVAAYFATGPYAVVSYCDTQTRTTFYRLHVLQEPPEQIACIFGDGIHNLRSALDHLANVLVIEGGGTPTKDTAFPIAVSANGFSGTIGRTVQGASVRAMRLVQRLQPYQGGTEAFWILHQLDIIDKHRLLPTLGAGFNSVMMDLHGPPEWGFPTPKGPPRGGGMGPGPGERWAPDGAVLWEHPYDPQMEVDAEFIFEVVVNEASVPISYPAIPILKRLIDFTERVVQIFDRHIFGAQIIPRISRRTPRAEHLRFTSVLPFQDSPP